MRLALLSLTLFLFSVNTQAQFIGPLTHSQASISQNSVSNLAVFGDTVWIGPQLQRNIGFTNDWFLPNGIDSITVKGARVYSLAVAQDTIFAGLGNTRALDGSDVDYADGHYLSIDGGTTFSFIRFETELQSDDTYQYGNNTLTKLPVTVPEQSPPYSAAIRGDAIFTASWASGIRRSLNGGQTFERIILPISRLDSLVPTQTYTFEFNPRLDNNFLGFSVFIDDANRVWFGSAGGLNWSPNALTADKSEVIWYHSAFNTTSTHALPGNWIIFIKQQPGTNRIWSTNWVAGTGERYAISYTDDLGKTFHSFLDGERIYSIDFYQNNIIAVGDNGIFISNDDGISWNQIQSIRSANAVISNNANYYSVGANSDRVWIGSSEGLITTTDFSTFDIVRVNFPLSGGNDFEPDTKTVKTYAYPNPFSISRHTYSRIVFDSDQATGDIKVNLYDFSMQKITELTGTLNGTGQYEALWNGLDGKGRIVANGVVFYSVEVNGKTVNGKILVMD
ncbi:hypothetical protein EP331_13570 [bacterium]|nr:MAG: hypothetical protein EP331_13570 [bacterium]